MITLICAMGKNQEIGEKNRLLWDLPRDMKHFRERTAGKTVVMGRKTFESIGFALPKRRNIVLTRNNDFSAKGIEAFHSLEKVLDLADEKKEEIMVIGGSAIYELFLPYAHRLSLTFVDKEFPNADSYFPKFEKNDFSIKEKNIWKKDEKNIFDMVQIEYERKI